MNLILELTGHTPSPDAIRRKVFGTDGGRIGRAVDCEWVFASPYVSRHHATVRYAEGTFFIESTGENGVAMNSPDAMLPQLERRALKNGDRLFIDDLEIHVVLGESAVSMGVAPGALGPAPGGALGAPSGAALDPLLNLPGGRSAAPTSPEVPWNASSSLADHFTPPRMTPRALPVAEDWDDAGLDRTPVRSKAPLQVVPPSRDPDVFAALGADAAVAPGAAAGFNAPSAPRTAGSMSAGGGSIPAATRPISPEGFDIAPLLHALGVDPATLTPAARDTLAVSVRSVLQGLIDLLRARAEFRSQFRLQDTRITLTENNPLKFAINGQDALGWLFGAQERGQLGRAGAFEDAFHDMRCHQLATLAGMRAGFES